MRTIEEEVLWVKQWICQQLESIRMIQYIPFRVLLYITIIEGFAQQEAKYPRNNNAKYFSDFIVKYGGAFRDVLNEICPVTLYYDYKNIFEFDRLRFQYARIYCAGDQELVDEVCRLCNYMPAEKRCSFSSKHKYANLIYAMRSKVVHELNYINSPINFQQNNEYQVPHIGMRSKSKFDEKSNEVKLDFDAWTLHIPEKFVEDILRETTSNYLEECIRKQKMPFENHSDERKCQLAWYD